MRRPHARPSRHARTHARSAASTPITDRWELEAAELAARIVRDQEKQPTKPSRDAFRARRLVTSIAFVTLFFAGAALSAGAGEAVSELVEGISETGTTSTGETTTAETTPGETETGEADAADAVVVEPAPAAVSPEAPPEVSPAAPAEASGDAPAAPPATAAPGRVPRAGGAGDHIHVGY
jgi:hypothetical protein